MGFRTLATAVVATLAVLVGLERARPTEKTPDHGTVLSAVRGPATEFRLPPGQSLRTFELHPLPEGMTLEAELRAFAPDPDTYPMTCRFFQENDFPFMSRLLMSLFDPFSENLRGAQHDCIGDLGGFPLSRIEFSVQRSNLPEVPVRISIATGPFSADSQEKPHDERWTVMLSLRPHPDVPGSREIRHDFSGTVRMTVPPAVHMENPGPETLLTLDLLSPHGLDSCRYVPTEDVHGDDGTFAFQRCASGLASGDQTDVQAVRLSADAPQDSSDVSLRMLSVRIPYTDTPASPPDSEFLRACRDHAQSDGVPMLLRAMKTTNCTLAARRLAHTTHLLIETPEMRRDFDLRLLTGQNQLVALTCKSCDFSSPEAIRNLPRLRHLDLCHARFPAHAHLLNHPGLEIITTPNFAPFSSRYPIEHEVFSRREFQGARPRLLEHCLSALQDGPA